jgi:hypothetical protein
MSTVPYCYRMSLHHLVQVWALRLYKCCVQQLGAVFLIERVPLELIEMPNHLIRYPLRLFVLDPMRYAR